VLTAAALLTALARLLVRLLTLLVVLLAAATLLLATLSALLVLLIGHQIGSLLLMQTLVVAMNKARAASSLAQGSKKTKHIVYARAHLLKMQRKFTTAHKTGNRQNSELFEHFVPA
jgi:hypothetical protein